MKISNEQKKLNRQALLRAAVSAMASSSYEEVSLRQISVAAGLSEPVIYSYFPNKQSLLYFFWADSLERALLKVGETANFSDLPFAEQITLFVESHLAVLERDIGFVRKTFALVFVTGLSSTQESVAGCRQLFATFVKECLEEAVHAGELATPPFVDTIASMFWDFHVGILHYWLNDQSEMQTATSEMLQRSIAVIVEVLRSGFLPRVVDLAYFLIRTHLLSPNLNTGKPSKKKGVPEILVKVRD